MYETHEDVGAITRTLVGIAREIVEGEDVGTLALPTAAVPDFVADPWVDALIDRAGLGLTDTIILRILLAAETEPIAYRVLQRLAGDPAQPGVAVDALVIAMRAFGVSSYDVLAALRPTAPLVFRGIVHVHGDAKVPPLARRLTMPPRLVDFLVTGATPAARAQPVVHVEPALVAAQLVPVDTREGAGTAFDHVRRALPRVLEGDPIWLAGAPGCGRKTALATAAAELGYAVIAASAEDVLAVKDPQIAATLWTELLIHNAILCIADADAHLPNADVLSLYAVLVRAKLPVVFTSDQPPATQELERAPEVIRFAAASPEATHALWQRLFPESDEIEYLTQQFRLTPGRIVRVANAARRSAELDKRSAVTTRDIANAVSVSVAQQVAILGNLIEDTQTWDDIVLPADTLDSIIEMIARVRHRHTVLDRWGFRRKLSKGLGLAALFSGAPGTGKTMVASLIARELGQELYQIDLSRVVSKWVGETEKNLARVFDAAEGANVVLLFDEADSLFSRRTEVKSSNDRHSNAEVNYLLQRVERFEGICILTTNFEGSIDPAFKRRLAFRMSFPLPDENERAELWRRMIPTSADIAPDINFKELGREYELAGGNIRNAIVRAAFLAATEHRRIDRELLLRAVRLEYRDAGKFTTDGRIS